MVRAFPLSPQDPRGDLVSICLVGISAIGVWAVKDLHITPFPDTLSASFLVRLPHLLSLRCLPTLLLCTHCLHSDLLPKGLSGPQTLFPACLPPTFPIPCPVSPRSSSYPGPWSSPGSITAFSPSPPTALHLHNPPVSRHCWPFCRRVAAPCSGTPSRGAPRAGAAATQQGGCSPPRQRGHSCGVRLLPVRLVTQQAQHSGGYSLLSGQATRALVVGAKPPGCCAGGWWAGAGPGGGSTGLLGSSPEPAAASL